MATTRKKTGTVKAAKKAANRSVAKKSKVVKTRAKKKAAPLGPLVSVVMPVFNVAKIIDDTIHSVLGQSYENFELIIVDDHSADKTLEVISQFKSDKIRVIKCKRNGGAINATNRGIRAARGKYLAFIDAGDMWQPNKLKRQLDFMLEKDVAFAFSSYVFADKKGRPKGKVVRMPDSIDVSRNSLIVTSTVMLDMKKLKKSDVKFERDKKWQRALDKAGCGCGMHEVMAIRGYNPNLSFFEKMRRGVR